MNNLRKAYLKNGSGNDSRYHHRALPLVYLYFDILVLWGFVYFGFVLWQERF